MQQLTVKTLFDVLKKKLKEHPEIANKKIAISDDNEGNSYHGLFYAITFDPNSVRECIEYSNGVSDSDTQDPNELVLLG